MARSVAKRKLLSTNGARRQVNRLPPERRVADILSAARSVFAEKGYNEALISDIAEQNGIPIMVHTGTSIFPGARNKYGDPIYVDDVAVDFPKLKILLAHGGRPLWMETAFFLVRRHSNVYLDISGIPPKTLLKYFPRLEEIADKTLFGTDWPGPGVPEIRQNLDDFRGLSISEHAKEQILRKTALSIWPR